jgi:hypothetical protein
LHLRVELFLPDHKDDVNCSAEEDRSALVHNLTNSMTKEGKEAGKPLKVSMHALMRLFLCSPDEEEANEGGVSMMTPAARPADG